MPQTHLPPQWDKRLLAMLNARGWDAGKFAPEALRLLAAWARAEGGTATWNPLNSTSRLVQDGRAWQTSPDYNSTGVRNYDTPTHGVAATAATLLNGNYNGIVGFLQAPAITAEQAVRKYADQFRKWGTDTNLLLAVLEGM